MLYNAQKSFHFWKKWKSPAMIMSHDQICKPNHIFVFFFTLGFWIWKKFYLLRISIIFLVELGIAINYYCKLQLRYIEQNIISLMHNRKQNNNEIHFFYFFLKTNTKVKRAAGCNLESITTDFFFTKSCNKN